VALPSCFGPSLRAAGLRNDIDEQVIRTVFDGWRIQHVTRARVPSDTRTLELPVVRLTTQEVRASRSGR
jgi:hypothetical protein